MAKKKADPAVPVLSLDEISGYSVNESADQVAGRYQARTRAFVEMGKLVWHLENRVGLPKGQTIYGLLQKAPRNVPEGSVHNARMVSTFISAFVVPGLVSEARADEIITHRVVNMCGRLLSGKSAVKLTAEDLAPFLNQGNKAAIGDELECLDEHGVTIAERTEAEAKRRADEARVAEKQANAAKLPAAGGPAPTTDPEPVVVDGTKAKGKTTPPATTTPPAPTGEGEGEGEGDAAPSSSPGSSHDLRPVSAAEVLEKMAEAELQSYGLDADGLAEVRAKLADWMELIDSTLASAKKHEQAAA